jgi:DNA-binding NarL/FixJ family response regulator
MDRNPTQPMQKKRILVVDDHPMVRDGLSALIDDQPDMMVCARCATMAEAMAQIRSSRPDMAIVDISLQDSHGIDIVRRIRAFDDSIKILVFSMYDPTLYAEVAFQMGATSYLHKQEAQTSTISAIRQTLEGRRFCSKHNGGDGAETRPPAAVPRTALSSRELQVFHLLGEGRSTREIAEILNLSQHTIDTHRENIKGKLRLRSGNELVRAAVQWVHLGSHTASS